MSKKPDAAAFLAAMQGAQPERDEPPVRSMTPSAVPEAAPAATAALEAVQEAAAEPPGPVRERASRAKAKPSRAQLKHFGGYLDDETLEKIALLRIRLKKDNSELIKFAIEELHRKHNAKRAFGDA